MKRRTLLIGLSASIFNLVFSSQVLSRTAGTVFNIRWRDLDVGYSSLNVKKRGEKLYVSVEVLINVSLLKINIFSYSLKCNEIWQNKELLSLDSEVVMGKKREYCKAKKLANGLKIDGSAFVGTVKGNPATTSYFTPDFLKRETWISTQNGTPLKIKTKNLGNEKIVNQLGTFEATNWEISGDLNLNLYYTQENEWIASKFKAGGSLAYFTLHNKIGRGHEIWEQS